MSATTVEALQRQYPSIEPVLEAAAGVDLDAREVKYAKGTLKYDALCLCLGAAPKVPSTRERRTSHNTPNLP